ncbi:hypothetical protein KEM55_001734 [Ascosphaera atra]|nr:hypothetical protein KEM55_001734 [Ascosphaera atra]
MNEKAVDQLLQGLVLAYFNPRTRDNLTLRQALTYFFPVYCHSRIDNARHMCRIAVSMVRIILAATEEFYSLEAEEDSDGELVNDGAGEQEVRALMGSVVGMLVEWTDERRVVEAAASTSMLGTDMAQQKPHAFLHLRVAKDLLERVLGTGEWSSAAGKEESKYLLSMLSKLYIPPPAGNEADDNIAGRELATEVKGLLDEAIDMEVARDATGRNALVKAKNAVLKLLATPATAEGRSRRVGRTRVGRSEGESTVGDTTVASVATEGTGAQETTTIAEEQEGDGETEGETRGGEEGEATVLARGMEQMRV